MWMWVVLSAHELNENNCVALVGCVSSSLSLGNSRIYGCSLSQLAFSCSLPPFLASFLSLTLSHYDILLHTLYIWCSFWGRSSRDDVSKWAGLVQSSTQNIISVQLDFTMTELTAQFGDIHVAWALQGRLTAFMCGYPVALINIAFHNHAKQYSTLSLSLCVPTLESVYRVLHHGVEQFVDLFGHSSAEWILPFMKLFA